MAKDFIAGAIKRPGALTRRAKAAGESTGEYARSHEHAPGLAGQESRFAMLLARFRRNRGSKKTIAGK